MQNLEKDYKEQKMHITFGKNMLALSQKIMLLT